MILANAKRSDQAIDRVPNGVAPAPQPPVVPSGVSGQIDTTCLEHVELAQLTLHLIRCGIVAHALQDFAKDEIDQPEALTIELRIQPVRFWMVVAVKVIDPDGRVDDHHVVT